MTAEEVDNTLTRWRSAARKNSLTKYKGQNEANIIGHFGLGFYLVLYGK